MTTLIADLRENLLYADKRGTSGKLIKEDTVNKLFKITFRNKDTCWLAFSGDLYDAPAIIHFLSNLKTFEDLSQIYLIDEDKRPKVEDFEGFLARKNGDVYLIDDKLKIVPVESDYWAMGAGWREAIVLLDVGIPVKDIFSLLDDRTTHTCKEYSVVNYKED